MNLKYYAVDPKGNVTESDALTGQAIEVAIDLDLYAPEMRNNLLAVADYINRNQVAPQPRAEAEPKS
jgi:hypothetical protein